MVFAIINYGGYRSMLFTEETTIGDEGIAVVAEEAAMGEEESETIETIEIIEAADTIKYELREVSMGSDELRWVKMGSDEFR